MQGMKEPHIALRKPEAYQANGTNLEHKKRSADHFERNWFKERRLLPHRSPVWDHRELE